MNKENVFTAKDASELLWPYTQKIFKNSLSKFEKIELDTSLEDEAKKALILISDKLSIDIDTFSIELQKIIYEKITNVLAVFYAIPEMELSHDFCLCFSEEDQISLLLRGEVANMNLRALTRH